jgi:lactocepin
MKVFGANGGAYTDDYMAAIEDALVLDCDVVNLSLGSSAAGYSLGEEEYINDIFKKLEGTSTVVSISAGNSGRWADNSV